MVRIFVEGRVDDKFIADLIQYLAHKMGVVAKEFKIRSTNGFTTLLNEDNRKAFEEYKNDTVLIIFDADDNPTQRRERINNDLGSINVNAQIFLIPNDNDNGNIETLFEKIAIEVDLVNCFKSYKACLVDKGKGYQLPDRKSQFFAYMESLTPKNEREKKLKAANWDFTNAHQWNLNEDYLTPLKNFLAKYLL